MTPDLTNMFFIALKALILFGLGMYMIFAFMIVRQEQLMAHVLEEQFEPVLRLVCMIHFIASILLLPLAFVVL